MNKSKFNSLCLVLPVITGLALSAVSGHAQSATATISDVAVAGGYDYTITLDNTGTLNLQSFWYGWTQSGNNLPSVPSTAANSLGLDNSVSGNSIEWVNSTGTALTPGNTGSFTFFSSSTPSAITTSPSGESVAYVGGIDFSQGTPGDSTGIFSPTLVATPEPASIALLAIGSLGLLAIGRRKLRTQP
ncbi:MAG: PEP-CTERM sorting domain-containing protein [Limisphaerales bacterium]